MEEKVHSVSGEGCMTLTQYETGNALLYDVESGDAMYIDVKDLVKVGRLAIAAHVTAGRLKRGAQ